MVNAAKVFIYRVLGRMNPANPPVIRADENIEAALKLEQVAKVAWYLDRQWTRTSAPEDFFPDANLLRWAGRFLLAEHTAMEMPPEWPEDWTLSGTLRRWAQDAGGYGGHLLNTAAKLIVDWPRGGINPDDEYRKAERRNAVYFTAAFPELYTILTDPRVFPPSVTEAQVETLVKEGDLVIVPRYGSMVIQLRELAEKLDANEITDEQVLEHVPKAYQEAATRYIAQLRSGDVNDVAHAIRGCETALDIANDVLVKVLEDDA